ncbi:MAG TPA: class I SAM-dependent methyltransferase [Afifellaceae bacterium]|nr:class I SAM-dependent methyltransferase [Afifellaceae bacterium]
MSDTPLAAKLKRLIAAEGPIGVDAYMAACLADPEHGYYTTRDPLGASGDFVTAPEVSQMFGEIIGAWLAHVWDQLGQPRPVRLVELGPGRGTLMADILSIVRRLPGLADELAVHLVEMSPMLRARQRETLAGSGFAVSWQEALAQVPQGPLLLVANEFFDALPVRQLVRAGGSWRERLVGLDEAGELAFGLAPFGVPGPPAPEGAVRELRPAADAVMTEVAQCIARHGGAALVIDYGHDIASDIAYGDTLQAVRGHAYDDPLAAPGEADITAPVDFAALARRANAEGAKARGPMAQGGFLLALGLLERAGRLGAGKDAATQEAIHAAVERLAGPGQMGRLFKVLAVTPPGIVPPPFDSV